MDGIDGVPGVARLGRNFASQGSVLGPRLDQGEQEARPGLAGAHDPRALREPALAPNQQVGSVRRRIQRKLISETERQLPGGADGIRSHLDLHLPDKTLDREAM